MSIFARKTDLLYLIFFSIHIPIVLCVDLYPLYPHSFRPQFMIDLRAWYIDTYQDRFFTRPPTWFLLFMWMELLYHLPLSLWAIPALLRNDPKIPIHLLVYAVQTAVTTATCIADYMSWHGFSDGQKVELCKLYVPYLAFSVFMGVDMLSRLNVTLSKYSEIQLVFERRDVKKHS